MPYNRPTWTWNGVPVMVQDPDSVEPARQVGEVRALTDVTWTPDEMSRRVMLDFAKPRLRDPLRCPTCGVFRPRSCSCPPTDRVDLRTAEQDATSHFDRDRFARAYEDATNRLDTLAFLAEGGLSMVLPLDTGRLLIAEAVYDANDRQVSADFLPTRSGHVAEWMICDSYGVPLFHGDLNFDATPGIDFAVILDAADVTHGD